MNIRNIRYNQNLHQKKFHDDVTSERLHLSTGFGGGKTYALCMKLIQLSALNKDIDGGLMCPTLTEAKKDVLPMMESILNEHGFAYRLHKTEYYFQFPWSEGKLYVVSGENKLRGPNWGYGGINELTLIPLMRYKEFMGRVRVKAAKFPQIASVGTPEGMASEYYEYMIEKPKDKFTIIYGNSRDNAHNLSEGYIDNLMDSYDSVMQQAYIEGLWVNMTGNRFYYSYEPVRNEDVRIEEIEHSFVHIGMDFNVSPMSATCWNFINGKLTAFDEITLYDADTKKMCDALKARGYGPDRAIIYPDPSGKARSTKGQPDTKILENEGFTEIRMRSRAPGFRQRQLNTNNLLEKKMIRINPIKCPRLKKDFMGVEQDKITLEKIKKNPELTHHSDGFDYMCDILYPFSGHKTESRSITVR